MTRSAGSPKSMNGATGHYRSVAYSNEGAPASQNITMSEPLPNGAGLNTTKRYFDGRGRVWKESANGYSGFTRDVLIHNDRRGNVAQRAIRSTATARRRVTPRPFMTGTTGR